MSAWIEMVTDEAASEKLTKVLNSVKTPHGTVDNVMRVHSLRPSTMKGHFKLYKSVLHDEENFIPTWFQETISSYVSIINNCEYSFANHWKNAKDLINDEIKIANMMTCQLSGDHRVIDGAVGAKLLKEFKSIIENPIKMIV